MEKSLLEFSRSLSYVLRHRPEHLSLSLDHEGWTSLSKLVEAFKSHTKHKGVSVDTIKKCLAQSNKKRYEIDEENDRIRAYYGHSISEKIKLKSIKPPDILWHGTSYESAQKILKEGLKPISRQYVYLSSTKHTALLTGRRKQSRPEILKIDAKKAYEDGINFFMGNEDVWLADEISPQYISSREILI